MQKQEIAIPINVIYKERLTGNGIFKKWEASRPPAYFVYRKNWTDWPKRYYRGDFPLNLDIEPTNQCNLRCPFCYRTICVDQHHSEFDQQGCMSLETFQKIINDITVDGICQVPAIKLTHRGEPLLNKDLPEMVRIAKKAGAVDIMTNTNGTLMDEGYAEALLDAGIDRVLFSFDSPYREQYEKIRVGASYEKVLENIRKFAAIRNKKGALTLIRVGMVITENVTSEEIEEFYQLFQGVCDIVSYNSVHEEIVVDNDGFYQEGSSRKNVKDRRFADSQLWQRMTINWDGDAEICCENYKREWVLGNIHQQSVHNIWTGKRFEAVRALHKEGEWWRVPQCRKCTIPHMG